MGQAFGSTDGLDAQGKQLPQNATGDQLGLTGGQMFARRAVQGGLKGLSTGLGQMQTPRLGGNPGMGQFSTPQQPMVDPAMFGMGRPKNVFYGN